MLRRSAFQFFSFFAEKDSPELTSVANLPLFFGLRKIVTELKSVPVFLSFVCELLPQYD